MFIANFRKQIEIALRRYSWARVKMFHEKTRSKKSRDTIPLSSLTAYRKMQLCKLAMGFRGPLRKKRQRLPKYVC